MASDVFFMNERASALNEAIQNKAVKVFRDAGLGEIFKPGDTVGIKLHLGEYGNSLNLRPQYIRTIVEEIQRLGGKPQVMDDNTLPFGDMCSRANESDHLRTAARHGFTEETMGCPVVIGDGEYGFDDVKVEVPNGVILKHSYMGRKFAELDAMIVVTHFKGHPQGVFGGALKNVGIGCGSKRGKMCTHLLADPNYGIKSWTVNQQSVAAMAEGMSPTMLDRAMKGCPYEALSYANGELSIDRERCANCMCCLMPALFFGLFRSSADPAVLVTASIADSATAYINKIGRDKVGFVSYAVDITPWCDCVNFHDRVMMPNIGVFASKDPVAIDMACLEATETVSAVKGSTADDLGYSDPGTERFTNVSAMAKVSQWSQVNAGVYNGLGTSEYNLIVSQPAPEMDFWPKPYTAENVWGYVHREGLRKGNWTPELPFRYESPKLSMPELYLKPKGKAKEMEIGDLVEVTE